ncbi:peptide chain release factor N(5)-glutamine methyltransferase [Heliobacterium chlorum]|uniref:Release factor glutamine methyltransferase n=1 Tax=Heliobacterium chlorum TaxID=2698 RepID=A0ABR7T162_HELCL|nr:HemK/PrmC family methyltransferase [Heliobacterium chlorum]MBC9784535.1 peptide chain release factor N(5)-glutamine methyltransferase [Heliobacterium chlorum]
MGIWEKKPATVGEALQATVFLFKHMELSSPRLEAEVLFAYGLEKSRAGLLASLRDPLSVEMVEKLEGLVRERSKGCPLQYITGCQEFWGMELQVNPAVLIPRSDTELLVEAAVTSLKEKMAGFPKKQDQGSDMGGLGKDNADKAPVDPDSPLVRGSVVGKEIWLADVGTGSGAIALAMAKELRHANVVATDLSPEALATARGNAERNGLVHRITFWEGDLLEPVIAAGLPLQAVLSNPPYIPTEDIGGLQREVAQFEPRLALDGGDDGLQVYRRLIPQAVKVLVPGGLIALEIGFDQGPSVAELLVRHGFDEIRVLPDFQGHDRIVMGCMKKNRMDKVKLGYG